MAERTQEKLVNTIHIPSSDENYEYGTCPEGTRCLGLVKIKNCKLDTKWGVKDAFRFVFRDRDTGEFASLEMPASGGTRSGFFKLLKRMSDGKLTDEAAFDAETLYSFATTRIGHWFMGLVEHKLWDAPDGEKITFVRVDKGSVCAHPEDKTLGNVKAYFEKQSGAEKRSGSSETGFESKPDVSTSKPKGKFVPAKKLEELVKVEPLILGRYVYQFIFSKDKAAQAKQTAFIEENKGVFNDENNFYHFPKKLDESLDKYFQGEYEPEEPAGEPVKEQGKFSFEEDDLPWK